ncbi:MAG: Asp/Glu/hydantoin racemase [Planctomycetes bacterium]|nr:Asp/Glu/hydantoin racemase [Planctomycetota bacterium]
MKKHICCVYTAGALVEGLKAEFAQTFPDARLSTIVDETLIMDIIDAGELNSELRERFQSLMRAADASGADIVFNTCSSVGELADQFQADMQTQVIKIDQFMMQQAVDECERIAVIATLPSTLAPTMRLLQKSADQAGKTVTIKDGLAAGAFEAAVSGDKDKHDQLIVACVEKLKDDVDGILLAQGSMARFAEELKVMTGKKVYSSVHSGVAGLKSLLEENT